MAQSNREIEEEIVQEYVSDVISWIQGGRTYLQARYALMRAVDAPSDTIKDVLAEVKLRIERGDLDVVSTRYDELRREIGIINQ